MQLVKGKISAMNNERNATWLKNNSFGFSVKEFSIKKRQIKQALFNKRVSTFTFVCSFITIVFLIFVLSTLGLQNIINSQPTSSEAFFWK